MIMVCSLALTDFLVGLVVQPLYIGQQLSRKSNLLALEASVGHSVCGVSFLTITAISLDRFLALHYHLRYFTVVTKSHHMYRCNHLAVQFPKHGTFLLE